MTVFQGAHFSSCYYARLGLPFKVDVVQWGGGLHSVLGHLSHLWDFALLV